MDMTRLVDSVQIPASMPEAHVPHGVTSVPKPFQLQVRMHWPAACMLNHATPRQGG
jgi:hypothetical protein